MVIERWEELDMLGEIETPSLAELCVGDLAATGNWVTANVRSSVAWPLQVETVNFRQHKIFVVPRATVTVIATGSIMWMYPFAAVNLPAGTAFKDGCQLLSHFLSSLSWVEGGAIIVEHWSGGSRAHPMGENRAGGIVTSQFELDYLPDPLDQKVRWALAFYREGLSLERFNVAYATLSFFKILNIVADTGNRQKKWINANYSKFGTNNHMRFEATRRLAELNSLGVTDIGDYLYASCRCAVAHAGAHPTIDPESPDDIDRLTKDLPVIRAMAGHIIEKELLVKSSSTIWSEHLYELAGFKQLLGAAIADRLCAGDTAIKAEELPAIPPVRISIKNRPPYDVLNELSVRNVSLSDGRLKLMAQSEDGLISADLTLNFPDERIIFDIDSGLSVQDDGSARSARQIISILRFMADYFGNGKLQIHRADSGQLLGRKDAFLPVNVRPGTVIDHFKQLITTYEAEAENRSAKAEHGAGAQ